MSSQSNGFGPWSTSLDNGTRMQLSAFWRQRMAGLSRLPMGRRLSRRWAACGIMATLLLATMPLVELSSGAVAEENPSAAKDATPKAGEEFVWRFSNGLEVELIGIAKNPSKGTTWWRPDGTPAEEIDVPSALYQSDAASWELAFRWRKTPTKEGGDWTTTWHTKPSYSGAGGALLKKGPDGSLLQVEGVSFDGDLKEIVVAFNACVSSTPWKKAFETDGRHASSAGRLVDGKPLSAAFTTAHETRTGIAITASYGLGDQSGRLVLFNKSGKELLPTRQNGVGSTHFIQTTFEFHGVALADVDRFELQTQTRMIETVEFHNVSLQPGHATKVVIEPYKPDRRGAEGESVQFGDVIELVVNDDQPELGNFLVDFEAGKVLSPPSDLRGDDAFKWARKNGVDAMGEMKEAVQGLLGFDMIALPTSNENWDPSPGIFAQLDEGKLGTPAVMSGRGELPVTYHFQTREGSRGVLQIVERVGREGVKIRYKLAPSRAEHKAESSDAEAESMSLEEALKIVHPAKGARVEVSQEVERQASNRVAHEEEKLLIELVESGAFALKPGELVKFVPASESGEARRKLALLGGNRPHFFLFQPPTGGFPRLPGGSYDEMSLMDVIEDVIGLPIQHVEGSDQTLGQELPEGDWIFYWDRSQTQQRAPLDRQLVAAFEKTLKGVLKHPVSLSLVNREMPVLFATGAYQANPIVDEKWDMPSISPEAAKTMDGPFLFPARRGDTFDKFTDFQGMTEMIGALLLTPIVDRSSPGPTKESFCMTFAEPPQVYLNEPLDEAAKQAVINAFEKQTSLTLTPGRREMAVLVVGDSKPD